MIDPHTATPPASSPEATPADRELRRVPADAQDRQEIEVHQPTSLPAPPPPASRPLVSWIVILVSLVTIVALTALHREDNPALHEAAASQNLQTQARHVLVLDGIAEADSMLGSMREVATTPRLTRELATIHAAVDKGDGDRIAEAHRLLGRIDMQLRAGATDPAPPDFDLLLTRAFDTPSALSEEERSRLRAELGWFADALLVRDLPSEHPERVALLTRSGIAVTASVAVLLAGVLAALAGACLLLMGLRRLRRGEASLTLQPAACGDGVYLESFAIYVGLFAFAAVLGAFERGGAFTSVICLVLGSLLGVLWPVLRGCRWAQVREDLGLVRGDGWLREVGMGVVGYCAILPLFVVGVVVMVVVQHLLGTAEPVMGEAPVTPYHPISLRLQDRSLVLRLLLVFGAVGFAPITEELMFRGALLRGVAGRLGGVAAALLVALIFAGLHPQGLGAMAPLAALGLGFALIRLWRGSLVASMTAHALHNGTLMLVALLLLW